MKHEVYKIFCQLGLYGMDKGMSISLCSTDEDKENKTIISNGSSTSNVLSMYIRKPEESEEDGQGEGDAKDEVEQGMDEEAPEHPEWEKR